MRQSIKKYLIYKDDEKGISTWGIRHWESDSKAGDNYITLPPELDYYKHRWCDEVLEERFVIRLVTRHESLVKCSSLISIDDVLHYYVNSKTAFSGQSPYPSPYRQRWFYSLAYKSRLYAEKAIKSFEKKHNNIVSIGVMTLGEALKELKEHPELYWATTYEEYEPKAASEE